MIHCQELNKDFATKQEMFKELKANKQNLISLKKATDKKADAVNYFYSDESTTKNVVVKDENNNPIENLNEIKVKVVINTTNFLDSHGDVHIDDIWKQSLKLNSSFLHLQEHERSFDKIISDDAKGYVKSIEWSNLGYSYEGKTQALIFESSIQKKRNEFMLNQYANGWVKNHSVGMRYVKIEMAINSESQYDKEEKAIWDKYYPIIANKELADQRGYFWAVTEAKIIEGSAVVFGSNSATPTLDNNLKEEPTEVTLLNTEPSLDTQKEEQKNNYYSNLI